MRKLLTIFPRGGYAESIKFEEMIVVFNFKKTLGVILIMMLIFVATTPAFAQSSNLKDREYYLSDATLSDAEQLFLEKVVSVGAFFEIDSLTNELSITLTEYELVNEYEFTQDEYDRLMTDVVGVKFDLTPIDPGLVQPNLHVSGGALYISHTDLVVGCAATLVVAAQAGPVALGAALTALASLVGGPVGTVIGVIVAVAALPSLTELAGRIIFAVATGQGIYIKPRLWYPPLEMGYW
jgi:hypothetical protein